VWVGVCNASSNLAEGADVRSKSFIMKMSRVALLAGLILLAAGIFAAAPHRASEADSAVKAAEAARLNNIGVAYMNQQLFER